MQTILTECFYAHKENDFIVLIAWAEGIGLRTSTKQVDRKWVDKDTTYELELIIELPLDNKELIKSLFVLVDSNGFKVSSDYSAHFKEEQINDKMEQAVN